MVAFNSIWLFRAFSFKIRQNLKKGILVLGLQSQSINHSLTLCGRDICNNLPTNLSAKSTNSLSSLTFKKVSLVIKMTGVRE